MVSSNKIFLQPYQLNLIQGLHPVIEKLFAELKIPPLRQVQKSAMDRSMVERLLEIHPLILTELNNGLRCTGNFRLFQIARRSLPQDALIPCLLESTIREDLLQQRAIAELLYYPAYAGAHSSDVPSLFEVYLRAIEQGKVQEPSEPPFAYFSKLYGIDRRRLDKIQLVANTPEDTDTPEFF